MKKILFSLAAIFTLNACAPQFSTYNGAELTEKLERKLDKKYVPGRVSVEGDTLIVNHDLHDLSTTGNEFTLVVAADKFVLENGDTNYIKTEYKSVKPRSILPDRVLWKNSETWSIAPTKLEHN
jgi:hypothetical protein